MRLMAGNPLAGKTILITGAARRIGRALALACARAGADLVIHYRSSQHEAIQLQQEIAEGGTRAWLVQGDLGDPEGITGLMEQASSHGRLFGLVNNASIFEPLSAATTTVSDWERHLAVNLTAPFLLSQAFAAQVPRGEGGRIVNMLDWRALRPGADHFPYTVSKAALAALTRSLAGALAPSITVNGLALGAILPPSDAGNTERIIADVPAQRWGSVEDVAQALVFLLSDAAYITGEIIHVDGGRHLV
jgi:pteridine reductase